MKAKQLLFVVTLSFLLLGAVVGFSVAQQNEMPLVINSEGEQGISNSALVLVIDISSSMNTSIVFNSTIAAAQDVIAEVDGQIPIALVTFGDDVRVLQEYSSDPAELDAALANLTTSESALLYDGALEGVELATSPDVENAAIILFTDSSDQGRSLSGRGQAIQLAGGRGLPVYAIALEWNGSINAETDYLLDLTRAGEGELFEVTVAQAESGEISRLSLDIVDEMLLNNVIVPSAEVGTIGTTDTGDGTDLVQTDEESAIDPDVNFGIEETPVPETALIPEGTDFVLPTGNVLPISIQVEAANEIIGAELSINETKLETFTQSAEEYTYDLDLGRLRSSGTYSLVFTATNENNLRFTSEFPFEVVIYTTTTAETADGEEASEGAVQIFEPVSENTNPDLPRQVLLQAASEELVPISRLDLVLTESRGLELSENARNELELQTKDDLVSILLSPINYLPPELVGIFTAQRTGFVTVVIIIMTAILLPQGLFTIYWMTYTWVDARRLQRSETPDEFYEPHYSFTALLPARREEAVIYDTIMATAKIDYPEHLKEVLVLIRDEDDDETIAETKRAIDDLRRSFEDRGEEWPNNVHLITFTDGPKNKPNGLNRGYKASTKDVICIYDAEDSPHPEIYNVINTVMLRDDADVVQSGVQLMNFKEPWFSAFNVLEYFFWFKSGLHAFTHEMHVTPLGGNTVFFKKQAMDLLAAQDTEKGYRAWDEGLLTEDADVGFRLTSLGMKITIVYGSRQATQEETPHNVEQFIKQRTRWCQGFYEIFVKGDWTRLPTARQRIASIYILLNSLLQASVLIFLPIGVFILLTQSVSVPIALLSWLPVYLLFIQMIINLIGIREFTESYGLKLPFLFRLRMIVYYYPYQILLAAGAMRAIVRFLTNQSAWEKTAHSNLHRKSTAGGHA